MADEQYPRTNDRNSITKETVSAKIKSILGNFKKAVDERRAKSQTQNYFEKSDIEFNTGYILIHFAQTDITYFPT